jgi:hypothetical protein
MATEASPTTCAQQQQQQHRNISAVSSTRHMWACQGKHADFDDSSQLLRTRLTML